MTRHSYTTVISWIASGSTTRWSWTRSNGWACWTRRWVWAFAWVAAGVCKMWNGFLTLICVEFHENRSARSLLSKPLGACSVVSLMVPTVSGLHQQIVVWERETSARSDHADAGTRSGEADLHWRRDSPSVLSHQQSGLYEGVEEAPFPKRGVNRQV